jgi:membrane protein
MKSNYRLNANELNDFRMNDWWAVLKRLFANIQKHNLSLISAGVAFYCLLAVFPLLAAIISLYGIVVSQQELQQHLTQLMNLFPQQSHYIVEEHLANFLKRSDSTLGWSFAVTLAVAIWGSSKGANALIQACNITYSEPENRSFIMGICVRIVCTVFMITAIIFALLTISFLPLVLQEVTSTAINQTLASWITWCTLFVFFNTCLAALYRYGPHRKPPKWRWVTPGSMLATSMWLIASYAFNIYLSEFADYGSTYGSVGGVIILLIWLYLSANIILIGAELNAAIELQTVKDSTVGEDKPIGQRGAVVADNTPGTY